MEVWGNQHEVKFLVLRPQATENIGERVQRRIENSTGLQGCKIISLPDGPDLEDHQSPPTQSAMSCHPDALMQEALGRLFTFVLAISDNLERQ